MVSQGIPVVFDANIYVSFFLTRGPTISALFRQWFRGAIRVYTSPDIISEIHRVFAYPKLAKRLSPEDRLMMAFLVEEFTTVVYPTVFHELTADSKDAIYLDAAVAGGVSYLITGDQHLLAVKDFHGIAIITPEQYFRRSVATS